MQDKLKTDLTPAENVSIEEIVQLRNDALAVVRHHLGTNIEEAEKAAAIAECLQRILKLCTSK